MPNQLDFGPSYVGDHTGRPIAGVWRVAVDGEDVGWVDFRIGAPFDSEGKQLAFVPLPRVLYNDDNSFASVDLRFAQYDGTGFVSADAEAAQAFTFGQLQLIGDSMGDFDYFDNFSEAEFFRHGEDSDLTHRWHRDASPPDGYLHLDKVIFAYSAYGQELFYDYRGGPEDDATDDGGSPESAVADPTIRPGGAHYAEDQLVVIATSTEGATIHYTTDGSVPTTDSPVYMEPVLVQETTSEITISALAVKDGLTSSRVVTEVYRVTYPEPDYVDIGELPTILFTLDGDAGDWSALEAARVDKDGDSTDASVVGGDITDLYVAADENYLYLRFETSDGDYNTAGDHVYSIFLIKTLQGLAYEGDSEIRFGADESGLFVSGSAWSPTQYTHIEEVSVADIAIGATTELRLDRLILPGTDKSFLGISVRRREARCPSMRWLRLFYRFLRE